MLWTVVEVLSVVIIVAGIGGPLLLSGIWVYGRTQVAERVTSDNRDQR